MCWQTTGHWPGAAAVDEAAIWLCLFEISGVLNGFVHTRNSNFNVTIKSKEANQKGLQAISKEDSRDGEGQKRGRMHTNKPHLYMPVRGRRQRQLGWAKDSEDVEQEFSKGIVPSKLTIQEHVAKGSIVKSLTQQGHPGNIEDTTFIILCNTFRSYVWICRLN